MDCSQVSTAIRTTRNPGITKRAVMLDQSHRRRAAEAHRQHRVKPHAKSLERISNVRANRLLLILRLRKRAAMLWARATRPLVDQAPPDKVDRSRRRCSLQTLLTIFRCNIRVLFFSY